MSDTHVHAFYLPTEAQEDDRPPGQAPNTEGLTDWRWVCACGAWLDNPPNNIAVVKVYAGSRGWAISNASDASPAAIYNFEADGTTEAEHADRAEDGSPNDPMVVDLSELEGVEPVAGHRVVDVWSCIHTAGDFDETIQWRATKDGYAEIMCVPTGLTHASVVVDADDLRMLAASFLLLATEIEGADTPAG